MFASRVGVHVQQDTLWRSDITCPRCGAERRINPARTTNPLCKSCRSVEPEWGTIPFERLPVSDSNTCAFDDPYVSEQTRRRHRAKARLNREDQ